MILIITFSYCTNQSSTLLVDLVFHYNYSQKMCEMLLKKISVNEVDLFSDFVDIQCCHIICIKLLFDSSVDLYEIFGSKHIL